MVFQEKEDKLDLGYSNLINISIDHKIRAREFFIIIRRRSLFYQIKKELLPYKLQKNSLLVDLLLKKTILFFFEGI